MDLNTKLWLSGLAVRLILLRYLVKISAGTLAILFAWFSSVSPDVVLVPQLDHGRFHILSNLTIIWPSDTLYSVAADIVIT